MPITNLQTVTPLSNGFTYEDVASESMVLTNTLDNEKVQLINIRTHVNINISYLARLMNLNNSPWYVMWLKGELENTLHPSGLEWINLSTVVGSIVPSQILVDVDRITTYNADSNELTTNCIKLDIAQLGQLLSMQNTQYRQTIGWTHASSEILFYIGQRINTTNRNMSEGYDYDLDAQPLVLWAKRKPLLDDLLAPHVSTTYRTNIDLPDDNIQLLIQMTQKKILEQLNLEVPAQLDQQIHQGLLTISQNLSNGLQFEASEREKRKYGQQQRPPGAV